MSSPLYIAVDLGAGSGRVFLAGVGREEFLIDEVHRFHYPPKHSGGRLRWDFSSIFENVKKGLRACGDRARGLGREIRSVGIDSWAVDYGLLDRDGRLIADPGCYRDTRTNGVMDSVFDRVARAEIFRRTGIQFLPFNTVFQLCADGEQLGTAERLLLLPDLLNYELTGVACAEYTNATTTQMVNAATGQWDADLLSLIGIRPDLLPRIVPAGTEIGPLKPDIADQLGMRGVSVVAPATHDTGSAVAGAPLDRNTAYISSGTWSLIGIETTEPLINDEAYAQNFTNEGGAYGTTRFLKNVMGLWIFESCRREWAAAGIDVDYEALFNQIDDLQGCEALIFPDDDRFLNPKSMIGAITDQLRETGQPAIDDPVRLSKVIFDSLAFRYDSVLKSIRSLTAVDIDSVLILGGGGRNRYLNKMTANASGLKARTGLTEATVVGNVLVQAIASGRFGSLAEARDHVREHVHLTEYIPVTNDETTSARQRYAEIEALFTKRRTGVNA